MSTIRYRFPLDGGYVNRGFKAGVHEGFDEIEEVGTTEGVSIHSVSSGVVTSTGYGDIMGYNYGHWIEMQMADGMYVFTAHMQSASPYKDGAKINIGVIIGKAGHTGDVTGPHVHTAFMREHLNKATSFDGVTYINKRLNASPASVTPVIPTTIRKSNKEMIMYYIKGGAVGGAPLWILSGSNYHLEFSASQTTANALAKQCGGPAVQISRAFANTLKAAAGK